MYIDSIFGWKIRGTYGEKLIQDGLSLVWAILTLNHLTDIALGFCFQLSSATVVNSLAVSYGMKKAFGWRLIQAHPRG